MATLHSIASGNFLTTSTWGLVDTTSLSVSVAAATTLTTTPVASLSFTPGAIVVKGVSVYIQSRSTSPTGTMTVALYNAAGSSVASVTINVSDLPSSGGLSNPRIGWTYFQFSSPVTLAAANAHTLRLNTSVANMVNVHSTGTTNWSRALVTTTTQAPNVTNNDATIISGQHTAPGEFTPYEVAMNNTVMTSVYGAMWVGTRGAISYIVAPSTNYGIYLAGNLEVGTGGTFTMGTVTNPIPASSTATLKMLPSTPLSVVILVYGTFTTYGAPKIIATKLAADVSLGAVTSTTTTTTGWLNGETFVIPSTTRTYTEFQELTLNANAAGTTLSHGLMSAAKGGNTTTKVQADLVNSTRNVIIQPGANVNRTNIQMFPLSVTSFYYTKFIDLGTGITIANSGICVNALTTGTFDFQYNVVTTSGANSAATSANTALFTSNSNRTTISNNLFYKLGWTATVVVTVNSPVNDGNYVIGCLATTYTLQSSYMGSNNVIASNGVGAGLAAGANVANFINNATNNSFYSNSTNGLVYGSPSATVAPLSTSVTGLRIWRNNNIGFIPFLTNGGNFRTQIFSISDSYIFGNTLTGIGFGNNSRAGGKFYFNNCYIYGGSTLVQGYAINFGPTSIVDTMYFNNCYFGYSDSSLTSSLYSTAILNSPTPSQAVLFSNCYFNPNQPTEVIYTVGIASTNVEAGFTSFNHNGVTGANKTWYSNGALTTDTTIYNSASPSVRMTPVNATFKLTHPTIKIPVKAGQNCTVSVKVRKSTTLDGTIYNGNAPRLIYSFNPALGNLTETIAKIPVNLFQYPQNFDNTYWQKVASSISANSGSIAAPDGTFTADLFSEDNTTNRHRILLPGTIPVSIGTTYNLSLYAKRANHDWIQLNPVYDAFFGGNNWVNFNLSTGQIGNTGVGASASITPVGDGWYRLSLQCDVIASGSTFFNLFVSTNNTNSGRYPSYAGTLAQCFYIWGAQLTTGSTLLPYYDNGQFENLTYTTPVFTGDGVAEFYVDCDGTTGWINVDDWNTTTSNDSRGTDYWYPSGTYIEPDWRKKGGGSKTFAS
jgi:hypothetical protein